MAVGFEGRGAAGAPIWIKPHAVAVLHTDVHIGMRAQRRVEVRSRHQLPAFPESVVKPEVAKLRHIARLEFQICKPVADAIAIGRPFYIADAEWAEQFALCELCRALAGLSAEHRRNQLHIYRAVVELRAGVCGFLSL